MFPISDKEYAGIAVRSIERLKDCIQVLGDLSHTTEDEFLYIGTKLKILYEGAVRISNLSDCAVSLVSCTETGDRAKGLNTLMGRILQNISSVVVSLQIHDVTRQQFEARRAAFHVMLKDLEKGPCADSQLTPLEGPHQAMLASLIRFSRAEEKLTRNTRDDFLSAVHTVIVNLNAIAAEVRNMHGDIRQVGGDSAYEISQSLLAEIKDVIDRISVHATVDMLVERVLTGLAGITSDISRTAPGIPEMLSDQGQGYPDKTGSAVDKEGEFGNNVELF